MNSITLAKSCRNHILNNLFRPFSGKLHRPSDKTTLHILWGVLLHPPPPHWCCYGLSGPSKGNLHCTLTAELERLIPETGSNHNWTHGSVGNCQGSQETLRVQTQVVNTTERTTAGAHRPVTGIFALLFLRGGDPGPNHTEWQIKCDIYLFSFF